MGSARVRKIIGDLRSSPGRTVLVILSIAIGVAVVGMVAGARSLMLRTLDASRDEGAFPSATLRAQALPPDALETARSVPGVVDAEARRVVGARLLEDGSSRDLVLFALPRFEGQRIGRVTQGRGDWPPSPGTMLVERSSLAELGADVGDSVDVQLPTGSRATVRVSGTVHDVNFPATRVSGVLYGYVTAETLRGLGDRGRPNELLLRVPGERRDAERAAAGVRQQLEADGAVVNETIVPESGRFWAADPVEAMVLLLTVLAVVCLVMAIFLVVNVVSATVTQQRRQIGVMKAIGARPRETARAVSRLRRHLRAGRVRARRAAVGGGSAAPHRLRSRADQPRRGCLLDPAVHPCAPGGCRHRAAARRRARAGHAREQAHGAPGDRRRWARGQPRPPGPSRRAGGARSGGRPPRPHERLATKGPPRADGRRTRPRRRRLHRRPQRARVAVPNARRGSDVRGLRRRRQLRAAVPRRRARAGRAWDAGSGARRGLVGGGRVPGAS